MVEFELGRSANKFLSRLNLPSEHPYENEAFSSSSTSFFKDKRVSNFSISSSSDDTMAIGGTTMELLTMSLSQYFCSSALSSLYSRNGERFAISSGITPAIKTIKDQFCSMEELQDSFQLQSFEERYEELMFSMKTHYYFIFEQIFLIKTILQVACRIFAPVLLLGSVVYLLFFYRKRVNEGTSATKSKHDRTIMDWNFMLHSCISLLSSLLMLTDASYVYDCTRTSLTLLFCFTVSIVFMKAHNNKRQVYLLVSILLVAFLFSDGDFDHPTGPEKAGFFYDKTNKISKEIADIWPEEARTYSVSNMTKWIIGGDMRTVIPFLVIPALDLPYVRRWVPLKNTEKREAVILDIFFPEDRSHKEEHPLYLVMSGLNGGSKDPYVRDLIHRRTSEGSTVIVHVTRGLMGSPIVGESLPHYARISDFELVAKLIKGVMPKSQTLVGVGYSMGGVVLSNYVARSGENCHLDLAISISGGIDARPSLQYKRSEWLWQPALAWRIKYAFRSKYVDKIANRLEKNEFEKYLGATSIHDVDNAIAKYSGYNDVYDYYSDMSLLGDLNFEETTPVHRIESDLKHTGRVAKVSIPLLILNALDDTFGSWRCAVPVDPDLIASSGKGNIFLLFTKYGGHVGWPTGSRPDGWSWMNSIPKTFTDAYMQVVRNLTAVHE